MIDPVECQRISDFLELSDNLLIACCLLSGFVLGYFFSGLIRFLKTGN